MSSSDTKRGRVEAYERMRMNEERIRALRGQSISMKQSIKSAKKSAIKGPINESFHLENNIVSPSKYQTHSDEYPTPMGTHFSLIDAKLYT
jgi:hypothetical protein